MKKNSKFCLGEELNEKVCSDVAQEIGYYSTALLYEDDLIGSGTFVCIEDKKGILTADHVIDNRYWNIDFSGEKKGFLGLTLANYPHRFKIDIRHVKKHKLSERITDKYGPDITFLEILNFRNVETIKARKSFYSITDKKEIKMKKAQADYGFIVFVGHPSEALKIKEGSHGFSDLLYTPGFGGCTIIDRSFKKDGYDYLDFSAVYEKNQNPSESFQGFSGGGIWRVPVYKKEPNEKIYTKDTYLAGVIF